MSWPLVKLEALCHVITKGTTPTSIGYDFAESGIPFLRIQNLFDSTVSLDDVLYISPETHEALKRSIVRPGDFLITIAGTIGRVAIVPNDFPESNCNQAIAILRFDTDKLWPTYLLHWITTQDAMSQIAGKKVTATISNLSLGQIKELEIPLPPLDEQKRIAAILDKADAIRRKRQQAIKLADDFLRSVFLEMFGDLSKGTTIRFGEVVSLDAKMVDPREKDFIDLVHIGPDRIEKETGKLLSALTAREESLISKKFLFDESYVLYSKIRPYLKKCALAKGVGLCSADMYPIKPIEGKTTREFVWMLLLSNIFSSYTQTLPDRASIPKLNRAELADFEFSLPDYDLQRRFSQIVTTVTSIKEKVENSEQKINALFGCVTQKAFSGNI